METKPPRWLLIAAFAAVFLVWGSSYLGIRIALETIPPFILAAVRFLLAGSVLIVWARTHGAPAPTRRQWRVAFVVGFILFVLNNGGLVWAQSQGLPSGLAALIIATSPAWFVVLEAIRKRERPSPRVIVGLVVGFFGLFLLINPANVTNDGQPIPVVLVLAVLFAAFCWAFGSLYGKRADLPQSAPLSTGMQLFAGGVMQAILSVVGSEWASLDPAAISVGSMAAVLYLAIFSSLIAFSAFVWLMRVHDPAKVSTYAYINPVIAVVLGWSLVGETLTPITIAAGAVILFSVALINNMSVTPLVRWWQARRPVTGVTG